MPKLLLLAKMLSYMLTLGYQKVEKVDQSTHMVQMVENEELESNINILVYLLLEDAHLSKWTI